MLVSFPKPQASNDQDETKINWIYSDDKRRETWIHCIDGSISIIEALDFAFFDKKKGLFNDKTYENYLPFYMKEIFDVQKWLQIAEKHKLKQLKSLNLLIQQQVKEDIKKDIIINIMIK